MKLIIDLEATCWEDEAMRGKNEIIEIGAVLTDDKYNKIDDISIMVKPINYPQLSAFCTKLTSITQDMVDGAVDFTEAMDQLSGFVTNNGGNIWDIDFESWGNYDRNQFKKDCELHDYVYPFDRHTNIKQKYSDVYKTRKRFGLGKALRKEGLKFEGTAHRGIDDANNMVRIAQKVFV